MRLLIAFFLGFSAAPHTERTLVQCGGANVVLWPRSRVPTMPHARCRWAPRTRGPKPADKPHATGGSEFACFSREKTKG